MREIRVLHVFHRITYSGAEIMYANAASLFQDEGLQLLALSTAEDVGNFSENFEDEGYQIFHKPLPERITLGSLVSYFRDFLNFLKEEKVDVLHIHKSKYFWIYGLCAWLCGIKIVRTVHNVFKNRKVTWLKGYLERFTARSIFKMKFQSISKSVYNNELSYYKNPTILVHNWFDGKKFFPAVDSGEKTRLRSVLNIPESAFVIVSTGNCSQIKNHGDIIRALKIVDQDMEFIYLHIGTGDHEHEEQDLARLSGLSNRIKFLGHKENVRDYLVMSDVFVMPSLFEGLGNAAVEAMACGVPTVLYNVQGLQDLIKDNDTGYLIEPDHVVLAATILKVYRNRKEACKRAQNALTFVEGSFNMETCVENIIPLYRS